MPPPPRSSSGEWKVKHVTILGAAISILLFYTFFVSWSRDEHSDELIRKSMLLRANLDREIERNHKLEEKLIAMQAELQSELRQREALQTKIALQESERSELLHKIDKLEEKNEGLDSKLGYCDALRDELKAENGELEIHKTRLLELLDSLREQVNDMQVKDPL